MKTVVCCGKVMATIMMNILPCTLLIITCRKCGKKHQVR